MRPGTWLKAAAAVAVLVTAGAGTYFLAGGAGEPGRRDEPLTMDQLQAWIDAYSNWGRWGEDDDLGAIRLITPEKRVQAAALVRDGVTVSLAELQIPNVEEPGRSPPYRFEFTFRENYEEYVTSNPWTAPPAERLMVGAHGSRSHLDALAHNFYNGQYYNGLPYTDITAEGTIRGGIENLRHGVVTRGILMDIPRLKGVPYLEPGEPIYPEDLDAWEQQAGVRVSAGDALFIHTGWFARHEALGPFDGSAGLAPACIPWLSERDVAIIGSDESLDALPSGYTGNPLPTHPVHYFTMVFLGLNIFDQLHLGELSEKAAELGRWEFLVVAAPLPVKGGTGSPVNPIAVF